MTTFRSIAGHAFGHVLAAVVTLDAEKEKGMEPIGEDKQRWFQQLGPIGGLGRNSLRYMGRSPIQSIN